MAFRITALWSAPEVNPINQKARTIPVLNPINTYGRVFLFSWWGFMIAFWSWYAFPPLLTLTIKKDLHLSQVEIANSNIISLVATLLVRLIAGPSCDRFGPRNTFAACLILGAIPTFLAGTVTSGPGLLVLRFFIGILGGSFVPCQAWTTAFFDKNVVGTANALTAGWGNAGGGITYFVMPAIVNSLVNRQGLTPHVAWRVAFVVPGILIVVTAVGMVVLCPDTPMGRWSERQGVLEGSEMPVPHTEASTARPTSSAAKDEKPPPLLDDKAASSLRNVASASLDRDTLAAAARSELILTPTLSEATRVLVSLQTLAISLHYFCTFGAELAINSTLGAYYLHNFPFLGQSGSGNWAAMFGLLNIVCRPFGGMASDLIYRQLNSHSSRTQTSRERDGGGVNDTNGRSRLNSTARARGVRGKKAWLTTLSVLCGVFQIAIGATNSHRKATMMGLVAGTAFFLEAANGATFALVPHIHPFANGIVSGITGAAGNLGGVVFAILFRYLGVDYGRAVWIIGVITVGVNVGVAWVDPVPRGQVGGR